MGVLDWFKKPQISKKQRWQELGTFNARFYSFGTNAYASDIVRSCIRPLARHTSKANAVCTDKQIERILNISPNQYMTGRDFLEKIRTMLELQNTVFIRIMREDNGKASGFYPIPYSDFEAYEYAKGIYIEFAFPNSAMGKMVVPWDDLVVLRNDYNKSDIAGDDNSAILNQLELINTTNQGVANAVKATANLRGILKSTKAILSDDDVKKQKDRFVKDYLSLENGSGIASLDSTQEFTPISMNPTVTSWETIKEFRENVQRYYGVSDAIITSSYTEEQMEAFYDSRIEPFLVALSLELTRKVFTSREIGFGAHIIYESNRIQYSSNKTKLALVSMVDRGAMTPNEWRSVFNLAPIDGGDTPIRRLDTVEVEPQDSDNDEGGTNG